MTDKKALFTDAKFIDTTYARMIFDRANQQARHNNLAIIFALSATVLDFTVVPALADKLFKDDLLLGCIVFWLVLTFVSFNLGGVFDRATRTFCNIAKGAWKLIPTFPINLIIVTCAFFVLACCMLWFPVVFVLISRIQMSKEKKAAARYLSCFEGN